MKTIFFTILVLISSSGSTGLFAQSSKAGTIPDVNASRIEKRIMELSAFGKDASGRGYRVAFTQGDVDGRKWFMGLMKEAGLTVSIDAAGNIIGKRAGKNNALAPIAFGSHLDMVPDGGDYDGCVGSIGALEVMEVLKEQNIVTEHPLELIVFSNEEGGTIGSMAMAGHMTAEGLKQVSQSGLTMAEGIKAIGGEPDAIAQMARKKGDLKAFFELHIEQGGILEKKKLQIGVVEGIVGIVHWEVTVDGFANHAGTTPMDIRTDALIAASKLVIAVNEVINSVPGNQVGTVGKLSVAPGAYNVIPGKVVFGLEIRDLSADKIERLFKGIEKRAAAIATETQTAIFFERQANASKPALTNPALQKLVESSTKELGLSYQYMQSGAGHDAQEIAIIAPVAMIFIPSKAGISHSPKEFSTKEDMANGTNVLLKTVLKADKMIQ
jgi:N-carbamoyl-L-amino-acid hydrolase